MKLLNKQYLLSFIFCAFFLSGKAAEAKIVCNNAAQFQNVKQVFVYLDYPNPVQDIPELNEGILGKAIYGPLYNGFYHCFGREHMPPISIVHEEVESLYKKDTLIFYVKISQSKAAEVGLSTTKRQFTISYQFFDSNSLGKDSFQLIKQGKILTWLFEPTDAQMIQNRISPYINSFVNQNMGLHDTLPAFSDENLFGTTRH